jgi:hypothetical protein
MNIFILDLDNRKSVKYLISKHLTKMPLETAQILCSPYEQGEAPYRRSHYNHPCCVWCRESRENYEWLLDYADCIFNEFKKQRGKDHGSCHVIQWCKDNYHKLDLPSKGLTPFAQTMPEQYRDRDPVKAYRKYYLEEKRHIAEWKTDPPYWWK